MIYAQVSGFRAFDTLTAGSVTAPSVAFGEAEAMGNFYVCGAEDGVFGLAFRAISRLNAPTAFEMLAPYLDEEIFAFSVPTDTLAGELVLGGVDESRFVGDLQWIDVSTPHKYWQAALTSASIGAQQLAGSAAVFDTGTTLLVTTEANAWALAGALDAWCYAWVNATSSYDVRRCAEADAAAPFPDLVVAPCGAGDDLVFRFGAVEARVPRDQYLYGQDCDEALEFRDCRGVCWPNEYLSWIDDGYCDDGSAGIFLNCPRFDCDRCPQYDCIEDPADDACLLSVAADDSVGELDRRTVGLFGVPGLLYAVNNNLPFFAMLHMSAATFQVLGQLKIATTALLFWAMMARPIPPHQRYALALLLLGAMLSQLKGSVGQLFASSALGYAIIAAQVSAPFVRTVCVCVARRHSDGTCACVRSARQ